MQASPLRGPDTQRLLHLPRPLTLDPPGEASFPLSKTLKGHLEDPLPAACGIFFEGDENIMELKRGGHLHI